MAATVASGAFVWLAVAGIVSAGMGVTLASILDVGVEIISADVFVSSFAFGIFIGDGERSSTGGGRVAVACAVAIGALEGIFVGACVAPGAAQAARTRSRLPKINKDCIRMSFLLPGTCHLCFADNTDYSIF